MENVTISISRDEIHEKRMTAVLKTAKANAEKAVKLFATITGSELKPDQWDRFLSDPDQLVKNVVKASLDVPEGMNPEKYKDLYQLPDSSELRKLLHVSDPDDRIFNTNFCSPHFLSFSGKAVELTEAAKKQITRKNVLLSESEHEVYQLLQQLLDLQNRIIRMTPEMDLKLNSPVVIREYGSNEYKVKFDSLKAILHKAKIK